MLHHGYLIAEQKLLHLLKSKILQNFQGKDLAQCTVFLNRLLFYDSFSLSFSFLLFQVYRLTKNVGFLPPKRIY